MDTETLFTQFEALYDKENLWPDQRHLTKDGIINPDLYASQKTKILFVAKDHNLKKGYDYIKNPADYRL